MTLCIAEAGTEVTPASVLSLSTLVSVYHCCCRLAGIEAAATDLPDISYFIKAAKISGLFDIVWACESAQAPVAAAF
jgi:hypothetical protein